MPLDAINVTWRPNLLKYHMRILFCSDFVGKALLQVQIHLVIHYVSFSAVDQWDIQQGKQSLKTRSLQKICFNDKMRHADARILFTEG